ncbi:hybrid sensor histidine kinase/response regulator [Methylovirgula sp. HY1]|uniref:hybrid sensor histidine kinase/response regulator n=1 Tax=Methylovirgula sp. HY1 TaxID=2822761 RepID=UPI001C5B7C14|nr:hybrid sensor histidine kinase/response regulator [Methylovirgula sp. HY1]QXX76593.1 Sensory/regulatory protein RpfC [Methylovirgula sp. HY1]
MTTHQRIVRIRRQYNRLVADETLEDYALRFTARSARKFSTFRVANTALGAISFLACEAIGSTITLGYGFNNAFAATIASAILIFATGLPIAYYAARHGVDIDLLTRGAGFGYIGSTVTSLVYASFTFIFFAIEASIMTTALHMCFGIPMSVGYLACSLVIIPVVTHGIKLISWFQMWTQPLWIILQSVPLVVIAVGHWQSVRDWTDYAGSPSDAGASRFQLLLFGGAFSVVLSLIAQIGEQVDFLRFLPDPKKGQRLGWWLALIVAGPGWILLGASKILIGSFLATLAIHAGMSSLDAADPTQLYRVAFGYVATSPRLVLLLAGAFVILSQVKINVTNSYAGSIAWSNFFSRLTHSHPGRVVWLVFNVALALVLMELDVFAAIDHILGLYANFAVAWIGALVADLVVNKPLKLSPAFTEFRRAHLYDFNPVGVGAMALSLVVSTTALLGGLGALAQALAPFIGLIAAFVTAPVIAMLTQGRYYIARPADTRWDDQASIACCICAHEFEPQDISFCPAYDGPICSLCCTLDARCHDSCKEMPDALTGLQRALGKFLPGPVVAGLTSRFGQFLGALLLCGLVIGITLVMIYFQQEPSLAVVHAAVGHVLWLAFFALIMISGVFAWLYVLAQESRQVAEEESARQTNMLVEEIEAHKLTDARLQKAKEEAENANYAKSRFLLGISHEIRAPLNAIFGYAQLLDRASTANSNERDAARVIQRSSRHLVHLVDGLLDLSDIEAGRLQIYREEVRFAELLDQIVYTFRMQAEAKGLSFLYDRPAALPELVYTDENRLWQILTNLLSNAVKYTDKGQATLKVRYRSQVADIEVSDTGIGIPPQDLERVFRPFERGYPSASSAPRGTGLGLTITKLLTEIMGGEISIKSEVGQGSTFRVRLLLSEAKPGKVPCSEPRPIIGYHGDRKSVLIVDDDAEHAVLMARILEPIGFVLFTARDGASCLDLAPQAKPDLFLIDLSMPGMNGWELATCLRENGHREAVIIIVSASVEHFNGDDGAPAPHDAFVLKPFDVTILLDRVRDLLHLEWIRESSDLVPSLMPEGWEIFGQRKERMRSAALVAPLLLSPGSNMQALKIPEESDLEELAKLGQIGYVDGIKAKLAEIEREDNESRGFVMRLRELIGDMELKQYMTVLESARKPDG